MRNVAAAWQEIRLHPARNAATMLAIVLSVAFLAATQVFAATESNAIAARQMLYASKADVVVETHLWHWWGAREDRDGALLLAERFLRSEPSVEAVERFSQLSTQLSSGERFARVKLTTSPRAEGLRFYHVAEGEYPVGDDQVVLTRDTAAALGVGLGGQVTVNLTDALPLVVVGLTDERGYDDPPAYVAGDVMTLADTLFPPPDYSVIVNPATTADDTPGSSGDGIGIKLLATLSDVDAAGDVATRLADELYGEGILRITAEAKTAAAVRASEAASVAGGAEWLTLLLSGCALVALLVGTLIIANTFTILVAQRRRQIGLLRAVGATQGQVRARFLAEAAVLGGVGTVLGVPVGIGLAALVSWLVTRSLRYGLVVPWGLVALVAAVGVVVTVLAALLPLRHAGLVAPMEALQPVTSHDSAVRSLRRRAIACGALALVGAGLILAGRGLAPDVGPGVRIGLVVGGALALGSGVLAGASAYVPALVRWLGAPLARWRPEARLAVGNAVRNPGRVGATATAVMLAVGLIVTVQVGAASGRSSAFNRLDQLYPVDLALQSAVAEPDLVNPNGSGTRANRDESGRLKGFAEGALQVVLDTPGVADADMVEVSEPLMVWGASGVGRWMPAGVVSAEAERILNHPVAVSDDGVGLPTTVIALMRIKQGSLVTLMPLSGEQVPQLSTTESNLGSTLAVVTAATMDRLATPLRPGLILVRLSDPDDSASVVQRIQGRLIEANPGLEVSGSADQKARLRLVLDSVTAFLTGLLGVAALVALVGVANTLSLSVLERTRESALLRALGLQASGLRLMLLIESLLIAAVSVLVGVVFGVLLGWVGAAALVAEMGLPEPRLVVDWGVIGLVVAGVLLAAAAASVLPGRRAAQAAPVEALADVG